MAGAGGRKAANHLYNTARADGLTLFRISSSIIPYAVLGESGVQYDIDKLVYMGTTEHILYYLFNTRKQAGLDSLAKLRAASGVRIGTAVKTKKKLGAAAQSDRNRRIYTPLIKTRLSAKNHVARFATHRRIRNSGQAQNDG
jgi:hypothetical protein